MAVFKIDYDHYLLWVSKISKKCVSFKTSNFADFSKVCFNFMNRKTVQLEKSSLKCQNLSPDFWNESQPFRGVWHDLVLKVHILTVRGRKRFIIFMKISQKKIFKILSETEVTYSHFSVLMLSTNKKSPTSKERV